MDYTAIATALAARYGLMTAPTGYRALRTSTFKPEEALGPLPAVLVFPPVDGAYDTGNGTRTGVHKWKVRLYYDEAQDMARQTAALLKWAEVFDAQLRGASQLGGIVTRATLDDYSIGFFNYGSKDYAGIEGTVTVVTSESWAAVA